MLIGLITRLGVQESAPVTDVIVGVVGGLVVLAISLLIAWLSKRPRLSVEANRIDSIEPEIPTYLSIAVTSKGNQDQSIDHFSIQAPQGEQRTIAIEHLTDGDGKRVAFPYPIPRNSRRTFTAEVARPIGVLETRGYAATTPVRIVVHEAARGTEYKSRTIRLRA